MLDYELDHVNIDLMPHQTSVKMDGNKVVSLTRSTNTASCYCWSCDQHTAEASSIV